MPKLKNTIRYTVHIGIMIYYLILKGLVLEHLLIYNKQHCVGPILLLINNKQYHHLCIIEINRLIKYHKLPFLTLVSWGTTLFANESQALAAL